MTETARAPVTPVLRRPKEVAAILGIGLRTVYELVEAGLLERRDISSKPDSRKPALRIPQASVDAYLELLADNAGAPRSAS